MNNITTLPSLLTAATEMDIMYRLEMALAGDGNMVVYCLKNAIAEKKPATVIIQTCKDMIRDAPQGMANILGETLCEKIKNYRL